MEDRIRFITHKGKQILLVDLSHCTAAEVEKISRLVPAYANAEPLGSVLILGDFTGAQINRKAADRIKQDAVPGLIIQMHFTPTEIGDYEIACAELCGLGHYKMHGMVKVVS